MKAFWKSKTFWLNLYHLVAPMIGSIGGIALPTLELSTLAVANVGLRFISDEPIGLFSK